MDFKDTNDSMPQVIYEGYKFPQKYAVFGSPNFHELSQDNSSAVVYVGSRFEINELVNQIGFWMADYEETDKDFIIVGLWDKHVEKTNDDYIMLATLVSHGINDPLEYTQV